MSAVDELRALVDERVAAVRAKDLDALTGRMHPDLVSFDVLPPLVSRGRDAAARQTEAWFDGYPDGIRYDVQDVDVHASGDVGWCRFVYRVRGELADGTTIDMWVRATLGCRRGDDGWRVVHEHDSVPFDPESGLALTTLAPTSS